MPPDEGNTQGNTGEQTGTSGSTSGQTGASTSSMFEGKSAEDWAKAYKGLQTSYNNLQKSTTDKIAELEGKLSENQVEIETLKAGTKGKDDQSQVLQQQVASLTQQVQTLQGEKAQSDSKVARSQLVMTDFPELAAWEAQGLLPAGEAGEDLKGLLTKFRSTLTTNVGAEVKKTVAGASPQGSGRSAAAAGAQNQSGAGAENTDYWWNQMVTHAGRDDAKFAEAQAKYDELTAPRQGE